jgi:hypothetical protein
MGRYYEGDIEGKFWFAVQASDAASRFGGIECLHYYFSEGDIPTVKEGIEKIKKELGEHKNKLDKFFKKNGAYNEEMLIEYGFPKDKIRHLLSEYADLHLGNQILDCLEKTGECSFDCEL